MKNVAFLPEELCHLCGTCIAVCPQDDLYFENEKIESLGKCITCGNCYKVCPGIAFKFPGKRKQANFDKALGNYHRIYVGQNKRIKDGYKFASGGVVSGLLEYVAKRLC